MDKIDSSLQILSLYYLVLFRIFLRRGCSWLDGMFIYPYRCRIRFCSAVAYSWTDALPGFPHLVKNLENLLDSDIYEISKIFQKILNFFQIFFIPTIQAHIIIDTHIQHIPHENQMDVFFNHFNE